MDPMRRRRHPHRLLGALGLLLLLAAMLPLSAFLPGLLPGGGDLPAPEGGATPERTPGTLEVTVVRGGGGEPVAGAAIVVRMLTGIEATETTDERGHAVISGLDGGPVRVEVQAGDERAEQWTDPGVHGGLQLAVAPARVREGHVRGADGRPAAATVALLDAEGEVLATTATDAEGRYELPDLPDGAAVTARQKDGAPAVATEGDLVLDAGKPVQGRLKGAGAGTLHVYGMVPAPGQDLLLPVRAQWQVQADGSFQGRLPRDATAWGTFDGLPLRVRDGEVTLPATVSIRGVVRRADGTPAARAVLLFRPLVDGEFAPPLPGLRVEADTRGEFAVPRLPALRHEVEVRAPECATRIVADVEPTQELLVLELEPGYTLAGFVVDTRGLPVPHAAIRAIGLPEGAGDHPPADARADAQGRFHLEGLGGTHARIRIAADGYHPTTLEQVEPGSQLRVVLQSCAR